IGERVLVRRPKGLPSWSEVRRGYLPPHKPGGGISVWGALALAWGVGSGAPRAPGRAPAVALLIVVALFLPAPGGAGMVEERLVRSYVGREMVVPPQELEVLGCPRCQGEFHRSDFAHCPFHEGIWICSYCCMSELQCGTACRKNAAPVARAPVLQPE